MKLYLIRHATASDIAPSDAERELTNAGKVEARIAGAALAKLGVAPAHILSSPLERARQTADLVARALKFPDEVAILGELRNASSTPALLRGLAPYRDAREILLVGHMPSLGEHLANLLGAKLAVGFDLGKGSIACVEMSALDARVGQLRWLMRQKQLEKITG